jgi:allantoicase
MTTTIWTPREKMKRMKMRRMTTKTKTTGWSDLGSWREGWWTRNRKRATTRSAVQLRAPILYVRLV